MERMAIRANGRYIDGTLGGGGHTRALLERSAPDGRVMSIDRDETAIRRVEASLSGFGRRWVPVHGNFRDIASLAEREGFTDADGVLLDIGLSSDQLDDAGRGFSFQADGPLDMRMDRSGGESAADVVNGWDEADLRRLFAEYGEEPEARRVAAAVVKARDEAPIETTARLAEIVERAKGGRRGRKHPATLVFQALRLAVNDELGALRDGLEGAAGCLAPGGRLAVISFHSLEDRMVKDFFRDHVGREESLPQGGSRHVGASPRMRWVNKKPVTAGETEQTNNPRARSAKLRVAERM